MEKKIFIYGGSKDTNVSSITSYIKKNNISYTSFIHHVGDPTDIVLDINKNELWFNGVIFDYKYLFMRNDVFAHLEDPSKNLNAFSENVYAVIKQYVLFNQEIKIVNLKYLANNGTNKILNLLKAKVLCFLIPETVISSNVPKIYNFISQFDCIQKPLMGGDHAKIVTLEQISKYNNDFPSPHKIQKRMLHPEIRMYRIGDTFLSFHIQYEGIDYRVNQDAQISLVDNDMSICHKLRELTDWAGLDYAAADFMTDENGDLRFLEVNSFPMFARFDQETNHAVSKAIIDFLFS